MMLKKATETIYAMSVSDHLRTDQKVDSLSSARKYCLSQGYEGKMNALEILACVVTSCELDESGGPKNDDSLKGCPTLQNQSSIKPLILSSSEHRVSCHRCGNIRKRKLFCSVPACPHIFCGRCADKMREEHGSDIFFNGCPVCKDRCCCSNKTLYCDRKNHCYRKCPATKARHTSDNGGSDIKSSADSTELTKPDVLLSSQQCLKKARIHKGENAVVGAPTAYATENGPAPSMGMGYLPQYVMQFPFGAPSTDHGRKVYASLHSFSDGNGTSTHQDCPQMESGDSASCKDGYRLLYDPSVGFYSVPIVIPQPGGPSTYSHVAYTSRPCHPAYSSHPSYGFHGRYYAQESSRMQTQLSASSQEGSSSCLSALSMKCVEAAPCSATSQKITVAADSNAVDDNLSTDAKQKSENPPSLSHNKMGRAETRNHLEYISRFDVGDSSRQREISQLAIQCEIFLNEQQNKPSSKQLFETSVPSKLKNPLEIETEISQKDFRAIMALTDNRSNRFSALSTKSDSSMDCASSTEKSDSRSDCTSTSAKSSNRSSDCPSPSATSDSRSSRSDSPGGEGDSDFRSNRSSSSNLSSD